MTLIDCPSPNHDSRDGHAVDMLVLHYTGMPTGKAARARLCETAAKVSAHYVVEENGDVYALVPESERAWHAGMSSWRGNSNINQRSIGIEIVNPGHEFGYRAFPAAQMESVVTLCQQILSRHPIPPRNVVGHSDVAPARKEDPGELFDWKRLAAQGVGLWPNQAMGDVWRMAGDKILHPPPATLHQFGYDITDLPRAITAFQRHFRPNNFSGQWDSECSRLLAALLEML